MSTLYVRLGQTDLVEGHEPQFRMVPVPELNEYFRRWYGEEVVDDPEVTIVTDPVYGRMTDFAALPSRNPLEENSFEIVKLSLASFFAAHDELEATIEARLNGKASMGSDAQLAYLVSLYDATIWPVTSSLGYQHPLALDSQYMETADSSCPIPTSHTILHDEKSTVWDWLDSGIVPMPEAQVLKDWRNHLQHMCQTSIRWVEQFREQQTSARRFTLETMHQTAAELSHLLAGRLEPDWAKLFEFLEKGPNDSVHQKRFTSPPKDTSKTIVRVLRMISRQNSGEKDKDTKDLLELLKTEFELVQLVAKLATTDSVPDYPVPRIGASIHWLAAHATELQESGIINCMQPSFRNDLRSLLEFVSEFGPTV